MGSINEKKLSYLKSYVYKKKKLVKNVSTNLSWKIDKVITQALLSTINYVNLNTGYKNKKKISYNQSIN